MKTAVQRMPLVFILVTFISFSFYLAEAKSVSAKQISHLTIKQDAADSAMILQLCLDLPEVQSFYPKNGDGTYPPAYIMQFPVAFSTGLALSKFQQDIVFESRGEIYSNKRDAFFMVKSFLIDGDTATVVFDYNHHYTTAPAALEVKLTAQKTGTAWAITNTVTSQR